ncbi:MAG: HD domain-containing phosphohydrolase [Candidatus Omnitrophota bacterium]
MDKAEVFNRYIDKISKVKTPQELFTLLEEDADVFLDVSFLYIFVSNGVGTEYVLEKNVTNIKDMPLAALDIKLSCEGPIIRHLLDIKKAVSVKVINDILADSSSECNRAFLISLINKLAELEAEVCVPGFVDNKLEAVFLLGKKISKEHFSVKELESFALLAGQCARVIYYYNSLKKEEDFFVQTIHQIKDEELFIKSLSKINDAVEAKDHYTRGHAHRVAQFSIVVAKKFQDELGKIPRGEQCLYYAAELHDVGKINIPDSILKKDSALTAEEYEKIKIHPCESAKMISSMEKWFGKAMLDGVLYHHENFDGTGYPCGRKGYEINILARVIRVSDSFDAMLTDRPYRKALFHHEALSELKKGRGNQFDPQVVDAFLEAYKEGLFKDIFFSQL